MTRPRHRALVWALSILLALATGAVLAQTVSLATAPVAVVDRSAGTAEVAHAFYEAANVVLRSGDLSALDPIVAPSYADHTGLTGVAPDRNGLGRYLLALRAVMPGALLTVDDVVAVGDQAMARVSLRGSNSGTFLGARLTEFPFDWGTTDVFRIADRQVVERWGTTTRTVMFDPLGDIDAGKNLARSMVIALERVTLEPGGIVTARTIESRLLLLEHGSLTLSVDQIADDSKPLVRSSGSVRGGTSVVAEGATLALAPGDLATLPSSSSYELHNDGASPASMIVVAIISTYRQDSTDRVEGTPAPSGVAAERLAGGFATDLPVGPIAGQLGRITLAPGSRLEALTLPGPLLLTVDSGTVAIEVSGSTAWIRDAAIGTTRITTSDSLGEGDGALVPAGRTISLSNPGQTPAIITLVTIAPTDESPR